MIRLIGVGDNTVDTYIHKRMQFPGGNAVNVAVLAHRYGHEAAYLGWLGQDERGALILSSLKAEGLDTSHCRMLPDVPTSYSSVSLVDGDRVFGESEHGASAMIQLDQVDLDYISSFDVVHTSVYSDLEEQLASLKAASKLLSFDFSNRVDAEYFEKVLPYVDIALISAAELTEEQQMELMHQVLTKGPSLVLTTRGKEGAWVYDGHAVLHQGVIPVEAVDTLGAGDAFAARFLVEYVDGTPLHLAMQRAAQSAAENCLHYGAYGYGKPY